VEHLLTMACSIRNRAVDGTRDTYGSEVVAEDFVAETVGFPQQQGESESHRDEELAVDDWLVFWPSGTRVDRLAQVTFPDYYGDDADLVLEVIGEPRRPRTPFGGEHHVEARARRVRG
jgi:hypothetical protein